MILKYDVKNEMLVIQDASRIEYHQLSLWLTRKIKGYKFHPRVKLGIWDGNISYFENGKIPMGLWKECLIASKMTETNFIIENKKDFPINRDIELNDVLKFCNEFFKGHQVKKKTGEWVNFEPYDYQVATAFKIIKNRFCLGEVATSGGKSFIISIVIFYILTKVKPDAKFLLIVPSISLVTQFYENIISYNIGDNAELGYVNPMKVDCRVEEIMSEKPRKWTGTKDANIYIGTYQSLINWDDEFFKQFYGVIVDESHQAKANSLQAILKRTIGTAYMRFGVSGTFPPEDSCEILSIQSVTGPIISQIDAKMLVDRGTITPMRIKAIHMNYNEVDLNKRLKEARNPNNGKDIYDYEKRFIQANKKKIDFIRKLVEKKCMGNTLVLFHTIDYGTKIFNEVKTISDINTHYIDGEVSGKKRDVIFTQMNQTDTRQILVASYGCLSTGISINSIEYVIFADSFKSESLIIQSIGRSLRKFEGKEEAIIYDLVDVLDAAQCNNVFYRQFTEREKFYNKREYPLEIIKVNL